MNRYLCVIGNPDNLTTPWGYEVYSQVCRASPSRWSCAYALPDDVSGYRYVFFLHWTHKVPARIYEAAECINFHCADLPFGRGGSPIENCQALGISEQPITAHRMTAELDAGPIYGKSTPISLEGARVEVLGRFIDPVVELIERIVRDEPTPKPQEGEVVRFKRIKRSEASHT
jgi:methionyl-tRNA formyltransferase